MKKSRGHGFHMVDPSPWPVLTSIFVLGIAVGLVEWLSGSGLMTLGVSVLGLLVVASFWWRDVIRESVFQGRHTSLVKRGLKVGFVLFLVSEGSFFFSLFWAFFHSALAPTAYIGNHWPPTGVEPINPWKVPLLNTVVLVGSGVTLTWSHHSLRAGNLTKAVVGLVVTISMGVYFSWLQYNEYLMASFTIADSVFGSTFYMLTGFHGLHVVVGTAFLVVCLYRMVSLHFATSGSVGFKCAIWYWHFVDGVWVLVYLSVYVWGSWGTSWGSKTYKPMYYFSI
uniref:Cytochrome c oxidase subunit 3 n=1 Tax=Bryopa lata TaxID=1969317 RepID=A0A1U9XPD6_9BIVA|nr:cytochrome c oxidase subunit III [Bryopa lata]AQZ26111.1 cytochrome c oxidase subunit III [Bryopa lata]